MNKFAILYWRKKSLVKPFLFLKNLMKLQQGHKESQKIAEKYHNMILLKKTISFLRQQTKRKRRFMKSKSTMKKSYKL